MKKNEGNQIPKEIYIDGEKVKFHYNREERLSKVRSREDTKNCFFCKKNTSFLITFFNLLLIVILGLFFSKYVGKLDNLNDNGIQYFISKKYFTKDIEFNFQIKNISKEKKVLTSNKKVFEIVDETNKTLYFKELTISKNEYRPNESYLETIIIDKPKFGNYKAVLYIDTQKIKKIELKFSVR